MNNIRAIITRTIIASSVALCSIVAVPALTFAAPNCNLKRDLRGANLSKCDLTGAILAFADLRGANLTEATLGGASLAGANLFGADFTNADLEGAFLRPGISRADMKGATGLDKVKGLVD